MALPDVFAGEVFFQMKSLQVLLLSVVVGCGCAKLVQAQSTPAPDVAGSPATQASDAAGDGASQPPAGQESTAAGPPPMTHAPETHPMNTTSSDGIPRSVKLVASLTVFALAVFVGFEVIAKVPPTLHTPLMSGSNAISGITVVGAIIAAGNSESGFTAFLAAFLALIAIVLATVNVVGGFFVTHRMLLMFKKR